jgi:sec-independent protein translocase protein TatA
MPNFPGGWELVLVLLVIVVVFGSKRLPDSARSLGRSMRILKAETKGLRDDDAATAQTTATQVTGPVAPQPVHVEPIDPPSPLVPPVSGTVSGPTVHGAPNGSVNGSSSAGSAPVPPVAAPQGEQAPHDRL